MTERIITDSNGRKHITNEPLLHKPAPGSAHYEDGDVFERIAARKAQPAPATELREQEPVALLINCGGNTEGKGKEAITALREALTSVPDWASEAIEQPAKDEFKAAYIEAMVASNEAGFAGMSAAETIRELSRMVAEQSPQRTWVGLTDEEMNAALDYWSEDERSAYGGAHAADGEYVSMIDTWRYIEAKLKEKNT